MQQRLTIKDWGWTLMLAGLCAGLGLLAVWQWQTGQAPHTTPMTAGSNAASMPDGVELTQISAAASPLQEFAAISERPLFTSTRRPPEPEPVVAGAAPPAPPTPLPDLKLVGVAITEELRAALVWDQRNRVFKRLEEGHSESGWDLTQVGPDAVVFTRGETRREIRLPKF